MQIRLADELTFDSIVDGEGLRIVVWTQGCLHNCKNCHNPQTHDLNGGKLYDIDDLVNKINVYPLKDGVTISGGDPFYQLEPFKYLLIKLNELKINVWVYTGFLCEDLFKNDKTKELLQYIDVLVDGPFMDELKDYGCLFRGSTNQRLINGKESFFKNEIILYNI